MCEVCTKKKGQQYVPFSKSAFLFYLKPSGAFDHESHQQVYQQTSAQSNHPFNVEHWFFGVEKMLEEIDDGERQNGGEKSVIFASHHTAPVEATAGFYIVVP